MRHTRLLARFVGIMLCGLATTALGQGAPPAEYVVSQGDSGEIVARSGKDGAVLVRDTDAATVIQAAIDRLPRTGGKVSE